jgi:hypothetical protein
MVGVTGSRWQGRHLAHQALRNDRAAGGPGARSNQTKADGRDDGGTWRGAGKFALAQQAPKQQ